MKLQNRKWEYRVWLNLEIDYTCKIEATLVREHVPMANRYSSPKNTNPLGCHGCRFLCNRISCDTKFLTLNKCTTVVEQFFSSQSGKKASLIPALCVMSLFVCLVTALHSSHPRKIESRISVQLCIKAH